jgi:hypothetical protein
MAAPDWASAGPDGHFRKTVLMIPTQPTVCSTLHSQRLGCFLETLARFRVDPTLLSELAAIEGEDDFSPWGKFLPSGSINAPWGPRQPKVNLPTFCGSEWISKLRKLLPAQLEKFGVG